MYTLDKLTSSKKIPSIQYNIEISPEGELIKDFDAHITLNEFNNLTGLDVNSLSDLVAIVFHDFNWPPIYWKYVRVREVISGRISPENLVIGIDRPVESLEYPGYFMIPYFGAYVVSKNGTLLRRINGTTVIASKGINGYYTYRMLDDSGSTQNRYRHRTLLYAFKPYPVNVEELDVNHLDGVPGNDWLDNLEWSTRSQNNIHAVNIGLKTDNKDVELRDVSTGKVYIFNSCAQAARVIGVTDTTIGNRARSNGYKVYGGYQVRYRPCSKPWPEVDSTGSFLAVFPDGTEKQCCGSEAAKLAGLTRTSLLRALREGRNQGKTDVLIYRVKE